MSKNMSRVRAVGLLATAIAAAIGATAGPASAAENVVNIGACQKISAYNQAPGITGNGPLTIVTLPDGRQLLLLPSGWDGGVGCYVKG